MATARMGVNIKGRVRKLDLAKEKALHPVFEAIFNSIQAIDDRRADDGRIEVHIIRDSAVQPLPLDTGISVIPVTGFKIIDNGVGFTSLNFNSFLTADSEYKIERGGKGVGRFLWLKVFREVQIESIYLEKESWYSRKFEFGFDPDIPDEPKELPSGTYE